MARDDGPARLPLRARLMLLLGAVGALLAATLATQLVLQARQRDIRNDLLRHLDPARVATANLRSAALDQETGIRGYALAGDPTFLQPYDDGGVAADDALVRLRRLVGSGTRVDAELDEVERRLDAWRSDIAEPARAAIEQGQTAEALPVLGDEGTRSFDELRASIDAVDERLGDLRARALDDLDAAARAATGAMLLQVGGLVVSGVIIVVALGRVVVGPIERLGRDARVVAAGDLDHPVQGDGSPDLVRLGADVDAMRQRILERSTSSTRPAPTWPARPTSWPARTTTSSSSPTSHRTTCRNRCARCRGSASSCRCATPTSSTTGPTSTSTTPSTAPSGCRT